jgi:hypothetical protein
MQALMVLVHLRKGETFAELGLTPAEKGSS